MQALRPHSNKKLTATTLSNKNIDCSEDVLRSFWFGDLPRFGYAKQEDQPQFSKNHASKPNQEKELVPSFLNETGTKSPFQLCTNWSEDCLSGKSQEGHAKGDRENLHEQSEFHQFSGHVGLENSPKKSKDSPRFCQFSTHSWFENPQQSGEDRASRVRTIWHVSPSLFRPQLNPKMLKARIGRGRVRTSRHVSPSLFRPQFNPKIVDLVHPKHKPTWKL